MNKEALGALKCFRLRARLSPATSARSPNWPFKIQKPVLLKHGSLLSRFMGPSRGTQGVSGFFFKDDLQRGDRPLPQRAHAHSAPQPWCGPGASVCGCGPGASVCGAGLPSQLPPRPRLPPPWDEGLVCPQTNVPWREAGIPAARAAGGAAWPGLWGTEGAQPRAST